MIERQLALPEQMNRAGLIDHDQLFFHHTGARIIHLQDPHHRWVTVLERLQVRYREPYSARHTFVSGCLMISRNALRLAKETGHGLHVLQDTYVAWIEGATDADLELIRRAPEVGGVLRIWQ